MSVGKFLRCSACAALAAVAGLSGCAVDENNGNTQQTAFSSYSATSRPSEEISAHSVAEITAEPADITAEAEITPSVEAEPAPDPVQLIARYDSEFLGLPDKDKVYIFRDKKEIVEINGAGCMGVSCYDDSDGELVFLCDFYISADGLTVYRHYQEDGSYRLLPEQAAFSGFDPAGQSAEDVMAQANALYDAVYGELAFNRGSEPVSSPLGNFYPVSDTRLDTAEKLNSALERYFCGNALETLLQGSDRVIAGEDGRLYCLEHYGSVSGYLGTEYTLTSLTEDAAVYSATARFEYEAGSVTETAFTCVAVRTADGWRFGEFGSIRNLS